ncbi:hypothetical protein FRB90_012858 [Tulasnella sp. 427]|nr:hypothetical protein FRB90_012858 [Tulasnella sp. 427]
MDLTVSSPSEQYVKNEKELLIPWSVSPFRQTPCGTSEKSTDAEEEKPSAVWNYAVFFCLTWHLWATQARYDIRYYTNDWWHRILFASQLGIYAILAAFSGSFNTAWQIDSDATTLFKGNVTELTAHAMDANQEYLMTKSFRSINILLFISRMLLFLQHARVVYYRRRTKRYWSWRFLLTPLALLFSASILFGCFIMIKEDPDSEAVASTQPVLWGLPLLSQAVAGAFTPDDDPMDLKCEGEMAPRPAALTLIILVYTNVLTALNRLAMEFETVTEELVLGTLPDHPKIEKFLRVLGISWQQERNDLMVAIEKDVSRGGTLNTSSQIWRWFSGVTHSIIQLFNDKSDPKSEYLYDKLNAADDATLYTDMRGNKALAS